MLRVKLLDDRRIAYKKGLWINGRKYYILESTAKGSEVGFPLGYKLNDIDVIMEPFENKEMKVRRLAFKP